jgi:hypothetical protein
MSTLRQIEANRRNATKSTGPTSATGKAASSMNALKTGIHAKSLVLPSEKLADLELLIAEYYQRHHPASPHRRASAEACRCSDALRSVSRGLDGSRYNGGGWCSAARASGRSKFRILPS